MQLNLPKEWYANNIPVENLEVGAYTEQVYLPLIIFSKDRAAQLEHLIFSLHKFLKNPFTPIVIWKASNEEYKKGYDLVFKKYPNTISIPQTDFRDTLIKTISETYSEYICLSIDDIILYDNVYLTEKFMDGIDVFSLRYGVNTIVQNPFTGEKQHSLSKYVDEGDTILWNVNDYHPLYNYGYPLSVDMHIYRRTKLLELLDFDFKNPNELESKLVLEKRNKVNPFIRSFKQSKAVNIPTNNMSGATLTTNTFELDDLNRNFLNGYILRTKGEFKVNGCHQNIPLELVPV